MDAVGPSFQAELAATVPFHERWEVLRPIIEQLYVQEKRRLLEVMKIMKADYAFDAESVPPWLARLLDLQASVRNLTDVRLLTGNSSISTRSIESGS